MRRPLQTWLAFVLATSGPAFATDGGGYWETLRPMIVGREGAGVVRIGSDLYVFGGRVPGGFGLATESVERYDTRTMSWSTVSPMPEGRYYMGAVCLSGKAYLVGGFSDGIVPRNDVFVYDPNGDRWSVAPSLPVPLATIAAAAHGDRIFVFGGEGADMASTYVFAPDSGWRAGSNMPTGRSFPAAATAGSFIYVVGGIAGSGSSLDVNERYDPALDSWSSLAPMPSDRGNPAVAVLGGRIYVFGGDGSGAGDENESYCPLTDAWSTGPSMPGRRFGTMAVALRDSIVVPGGVASGLTNVVVAFFPDSCAGGEPYCFCGLGGPCGNDSFDGGCINSTGLGALLRGSGSASIAEDSLVLLADRMPTNQAGIFWVAAGRLDAPFGDGRLCISSGGVRPFRFPIQSSGLRGQIVLGPGVVAQASGRIAITPGSTWNFQAWYRDPFGPCGYGFNTTNALAVTWAP